VKAIGAGDVGATSPPDGLPEPAASVVEYMGDELTQDSREFVPTAELAAALEVEPKAFAWQMGELGCRPTPYRMPTDDGGVRQVRGYLTADIRTAVVRVGRGGATASEDGKP
jgi:S-DNA-T family DNA segregation ATPase FtsK/SpoIIIE